MKNIVKISFIALFAFLFGGKQAMAQSQRPDTSTVIFLDTLRIVYIHADTGKALNRVDKLGHKQGLWEQKYANGKVRYRGHFKDDKPTGVFKYFYEADDSLRILSIYSDNGRVARVHEYFFSGGLAGGGCDIVQKKGKV